MSGWEPDYEEHMTMCDVSRLDKIREMVAASNEDTFFDGAIVRDLLAVVVGELGHYTPADHAKNWYIKAKMAATPEAESMCMDNAAAWEALT